MEPSDRRLAAGLSHELQDVGGEVAALAKAARTFARSGQPRHRARLVAAFLTLRPELRRQLVTILEELESSRRPMPVQFQVHYHSGAAPEGDDDTGGVSIIADLRRLAGPDGAPD